MFARLERYLYTSMVMLALAAVALVALPAAAEAQADAQKTAAPNASNIEVGSGDSLWSISAERLGPEASARQIAKGVRRIYASNREVIGEDPNLIMPGQELALPPAHRIPKAEPTAEGAPSREAVRPAEAVPSAPEARGGAPKGSRPSHGEGGVEGKEARSSATETPRVPNAAADNPAPARVGVPDPADESPSSVVGSLESARSVLAAAVAAAVAAVFPAPGDTSAETYAAWRRPLGLGLVLLAPIIGVLGFWKLPMNLRAGRGRETRFLPEDPNESMAYEAPDAGGSIGGGEGATPKRLLLIEDHDVFRECLALVLQQRTGLEVVSSGSLAEARQRLEDSRGAVDLAIVDGHLIDGSEARSAGWLLEANVPVLTLSDSRDAEWLDHEFGIADEMLNLDDDFEELVSAVETKIGDLA